ncbi:hypothetical protein BIW11_07608, partial [Tropilaelaps mercedesae]
MDFDSTSSSDTRLRKEKGLSRICLGRSAANFPDTGTRKTLVAGAV